MQKIKQHITTLMLLSSISFIVNLQSHDLVDISTIDDHIIVEMRYASRYNCTGEQIYTNSKCLVCSAVAQALHAAQQELEQYNLCLKIWDAYQPLSAVTKIKKLFEGTTITDLCCESHAKGIAVDVTLVMNDQEVPMGCDFDCWTNKANTNCSNLPEAIAKNRQALKLIMEKHGFKAGDVWWHFEFIQRSEAPILELEFTDVK